MRTDLQIASHWSIRSFVAFGCFLFGISHSFAQQSHAVTGIELLSYGIYTAQKQEQRATATRVSNPTLLTQTDVVRGHVGQNFGFEFKIIGTPDGEPVRLEVMIDHPLMVAPSNEKAHITRFEIPGRIGAPGFTGWGFGAESKVLRGKWTWKLIVNGHVYLEKAFLVE